MLNFLPFIQLGMKYGPSIIAMIQAATSNADLTSKIATLPADVMKVIAQLGGEIFPGVKPELQNAAGAVAAFDHAFTQWVQKACNTLLSDTPKLAEDGIYGPRTVARVKVLQAALHMQSIDGFVGKLTRAAIDHAMALFIDDTNNVTTPAEALEIAASNATATA
jgi:hypothetical protein